MMDPLLPPGVVCVSMREDASCEALPEERAQLGKAVPGRVRDFAMGRTCARQALRRLGLPEATILRGPRREPKWPPGVVGSITHCRGYCAAAVALQHDVLTVGIDAEPDAELPHGVLDEIALEEEQAWVAHAPDAMHWDRVLFSAKESVYKAWFPLTGQWLGFKDVMVRMEPDAGTFQAEILVTPPQVADAPLPGFTGRFSVQDGLIMTAVAVIIRQGAAADR